MAELIRREDDLNTGREKLNNAIINADEAKKKSNQAVNVSQQAKQIAQAAENKADSTQTQLDTIVIEGDSSVEAAQARVDEKGVPHPTLKARIDDGFKKTNHQLAEIDDNLDYVSRGSRKGLRPSFVFIDDDGKKEVLTVLKPLLDSYGIKFTLAIITGRVGSSGYLTDDDILELYNDGIDIVSHTKTHPNLRTLSDEELDVELGESKSYLENLGIPQKHLMYPYGTVNDRVIRKTKEYYDSACGTSAGINRSPIMTYHLRRLAVGSYSPIGDSLEDYIPYIEEAIRTNAMCLFMTHIGETPEENIPLIGQIIDYVRSRGYDFETYSQAYEKHKNALEQGLYTTSNQEHYNVVGANGTVINSSIGIYTSRYDEFNFNSVPSDFRSRTITITVIRDNNSRGFPLNRGGILKTERLSTDDVFTQQFYEPRGSGKRYVRYWNNGEWTDFIDMSSYQIIPSNTMSFTSVPSDFPSFKISITYIRDALADGFPDGKGGVLTTYRLTSDDSATYQEWRTRQDYPTYTRYWDPVNNRWSDFRPSSTLVYLERDSRTASSPITDYPLYAVSIHYIRNSSATGLPTNRGGIMKTYRLDEEGYFCYQEFKPYHTNRIYVRTWQQGSGTWNEFTLIGGTGTQQDEAVEQ